MLLAISVNLLQFGYQCSGVTISVEFPVKFTMASLPLVWYCISYESWIFGAIGSTLRVGEV